MTAPAELMTVEQFEQLPDDGYRYELSRGLLVREPPVGMRHGYVAVNVAVKIRDYVHHGGLGAVVLETGCILSHDPDTVRGPDISFVSRDRLPAELTPGYLPHAPDLAIEILSPSNSASEIERKVIEYLDAGTRLVWVIDPETRTARSYRGNEARLAREDGELSGEDVVPGFALRLSEIW